MDFTSLRNTIKTKNDLLEVIELVRKYRLHIMLTKGQLICEMYRGQGRNNWKLEPNIVRNIRNVAEIKNVEKQIINEFHETLVKNNISKHLQTGFLNGKFHSEWLLIEQAQHYGIPTRFMDWTINWEVALFFAVSNPNDDIFDADFWIYIVQPEQREVDNHESIYYNFNPLEYEETKFLNAAGYLSDDYLSKIAMRRVAKQNGRFLIQPYSLSTTPLEDNPEHSKYLHRITIPKEIKATLRQELAEEGYTNDELYVFEEPLIEEIKLKLRKKYNV